MPPLRVADELDGVHPEVEAPHGRAWHARPPADRDAGAVLRHWVVFRPDAHPIWHSYLFSLVHLRPVASLASPKAWLRDASHEISVLALDPAHPRALAGPWRCLMPPNIVGQLAVPDDADALALLTELVVDVCAGRLSPDTDFRRQWATRLALPPSPWDSAGGHA